MLYNGYMLYETYTLANTPLSYVLSYVHPKLLIASGFHGDESGSIPLIEEAVDIYKDKLPPFLFVPRVSPSAVAFKTRINKDNLDINRCYTGEGKHPEAAALIQLLKPHTFTMALEFHEDPQMDTFYLYDIGVRSDMDMIDRILKAVEDADVPLFSGIDDPDDPTLGMEIEDGYIGFDEQPGDTDTTHGFFNKYLLATNKATRVLTFEVPGIVSYNTKEKVIRAIFRSVFSL